MDLIKIGKYIAGKRKALGMTQRELAEKLGMSDKSVSKWERGVCLPDASVYAELCGILGIGINEFLAGEDVPREELVQKSEENIIGVTADNQRRQHRLKTVICLLVIVLASAAVAVGLYVYRSQQPQNFIEPAERDSIEMQTARLLAGPDGAYIYKFTTTDEYRYFKLYYTEYRSGEQAESGEALVLGYDLLSSPENGEILIIPDFTEFKVRIIISAGAKLSTEIPILENVPGREYYGRSGTEISGKTDVHYDEEQLLLALIYDNDAMRVLDLQELMDGKTEALTENDYVYLFSFQFCKEE